MRNDFFRDETSFNKLYPLSLRKLDAVQGTPLKVVSIAVRFLVQQTGEKILDIGSGNGKFCLAGAFYQQEAIFYGVEQQESLVNHARTALAKLRLDNVHFIHSNFTQLSLQAFDHFYFYNSFFENIADNTGKTVRYSKELYDHYTVCLFKALDQMPEGTRTVTYCSWGDEIPPSFSLKASYCDDLLKCWVKIS